MAEEAEVAREARVQALSQTEPEPAEDEPKPEPDEPTMNEIIGDIVDGKIAREEEEMLSAEALAQKQGSGGRFRALFKPRTQRPATSARSAPLGFAAVRCPCSSIIRR